MLDGAGLLVLLKSGKGAVRQHQFVALALLNVTDIRGGEACPGRECPLGPVSLLSIVTEGRPKQQEEPGRIA